MPLGGHRLWLSLVHGRQEKEECSVFRQGSWAMSTVTDCPSSLSGTSPPHLGPPVPGVRVAHYTRGYDVPQVPKTPHSGPSPGASWARLGGPEWQMGEARAPVRSCPRFWGEGSM